MVDAHTEVGVTKQARKRPHSATVLQLSLIYCRGIINSREWFQEKYGKCENYKRVMQRCTPRDLTVRFTVDHNRYLLNFEVSQTGRFTVDRAPLLNVDHQLFFGLS